jgi:hypothetical protein
VTRVCSFEPVVSILKNCMAHLSRVSLNVCFVIHVMWGLLLLNDKMYQINKMYKQNKRHMSFFISSVVVKII